LPSGESKILTASCAPLSVSDDDDVDAVYSCAPRPSEISIGLRVQGLGFARRRIDLERV